MTKLINSSWRYEINSSLEQVKSLQTAYPVDSALISVSRQLVYLLALIDGVEEDDSALEEITLGYIVTYQLYDIVPPSLAEQISRISEKVRRSLRMNGRRLKIDQ